MTTTRTRRALIAMASVTAGVAGAAVAPVPAYAADPKPSVPVDELRAIKARIKATIPAPGQAAAALPTCQGVRTVRQGNVVHHIPAISDGGSINCQLQNGDFNNAGVKVLQLALHDCNQERDLAIDADYGDLTTGAVKRTQERERLQVTGVYTSTLYANAPWPFYDAVSGDLLQCID